MDPKTFKVKTIEPDKPKEIWIVPEEKDYHFDENTKSIRRNDLIAYKKYVGDLSLTRKQIKKLQREERKKRIRLLKLNAR